MEPKDIEQLSAEEKKAGFKDATVTHRVLEQTDRILMRAIQEHGGFASVLVYGPSGVGKTTMIRQIRQRLQGARSSSRPAPCSPPLSGPRAAVPLLVLETRPPDGAAFNRADYYRNALVQLGEPFYEQRRFIDIHTEDAGERRTRGRGKAAPFNEAPELRHAMEDAMQRHGVRAVILDEAQHLLTWGNREYGHALLDQLDWIKSMTNVTDIVHILVGTYELLSFTRLNGQAARRGLPVHFPRYQLQHDDDCTTFQAILLALLKKVPLRTAAEQLVVEHWLYFYERCIGCVGVLKDWLMRAVSATLDEGGDTLTLERVQEQALSISQCEQMALDAVEGEQKLNATEGRREHLWRLLQGEGLRAPLLRLPASGVEAPSAPASSAYPTPVLAASSTGPAPMAPPPKTTRKRTGQQTPRRDPVGARPSSGPPTRCAFVGVIDLAVDRLPLTAISAVECPACGAMRTLHPHDHILTFPSHTKRRTDTPHAKVRWIRHETEWRLSNAGRESPPALQRKEEESATSKPRRAGRKGP